MGLPKEERDARREDYEALVEMRPSDIERLFDQIDRLEVERDQAVIDRDEAQETLAQQGTSVQAAWERENERANKAETWARAVEASNRAMQAQSANHSRVEMQRDLLKEAAQYAVDLLEDNDDRGAMDAVKKLREALRDYERPFARKTGG